MNKSLSPNSRLVNQTIDFNYANKQRAESTKWIFVNILFFLLFAYDLWCGCVCVWVRCVEALCAAVVCANVVQHVVVVARRPPRPPAHLSPGQNHAQPAPPTPPRAALSHDDVAALSAARAWRTPDASPPPSPPSPASPSSPASPFRTSPRLERLADSDEFIADRRSLADYLRGQEERARAELGAGPSSAWGAHTHLAPHYQLAARDSEGSPLEEGGASGGTAGGAGAGAWRRVLLEAGRVAEWNQNLRLWLHLTVLSRLTRECERVDEALAALGLPDLAHTPLERLHRLPAAAALLPYLEPFADQRYAVQRVRELARGGCLSAYRWDRGGSDWDDAKPTDAELVLQLLAAYLDGVLPPARAARPFSSAHLSAAPAPPPRGPRALAIHRVSARPPHYVLVHGDEVVEVARGRNNLLHTVLLLVGVAARHHPPALQRLHLGPAGLNLLWVIGR